MDQTFELLPGVRLRAEQTTRFKTGCFSFSMLRPLRREEAAQNALLANVLMRGTRVHPDLRSISRMLDTLYGASAGPLVRKNGEIQTCGFFMSFIEDRFALEGGPVLEAMIAFLGELLEKPLVEDGGFLPDVVAGEQQNLINMIASDLNDKRAYADRQLLKLMSAKDPGGVSRLGEIEDVRAATPQGLYRHFQHILAHSEMEIFYCGSAEPERVAGLFRRALGFLPRLERDAVTIRGFCPTGQMQYKEETMDLTQAKLAMGFTTDCTCRDPEYPALVLLNAIFGGGVTSKLFQNVREKLSLCYYASSVLLSSKGIILVSSGIETDRYEQAKAEILRQLEDCRQGRISQEELGAAKSALRSSLQAVPDSQGRMEDFYLYRRMTGFPMTAEAYLQALEAVTADQVVRAAQRVRLDSIFFLKGVQA